MTTDEFRHVAGLIHDATSYGQLFRQGDMTAVKSTFRAMMKTIHPDRVEATLQPEANDAVAKLTGFYDEAVQALAAGTFGAPKPLLTVQSAAFCHDCLSRRTRWFDMTTGLTARSQTGTVTYDSLVKIARVPRDNDLLAAEADALRVLATTGDEHAMYYPTLLDSTVVRDGRKRLRANVLSQLEGFYNLEQVRERYLAGIHPLDMGWIWRRTLWALGGAHEAGVLHGALVPSHIMVHPTLHGVVLVDWCYSVTRTADVFAPLSAIVGSKRDWYPNGVLQAKAAPTEERSTLPARPGQCAMSWAAKRCQTL